MTLGQARLFKRLSSLVSCSGSLAWGNPSAVFEHELIRSLAPLGPETYRSLKVKTASHAILQKRALRAAAQQVLRPGMCEIANANGGLQEIKDRYTWHFRPRAHHPKTAARHKPCT